jgi:MoaA/NifB/PqqE/SkfB family radical SAM enzyme
MTSVPYNKIITHLQIEITNHCNSHCPGCARNIHGGENHQDLILDHMKIETWKKIIDDPLFKRQIAGVFLNGVFGDCFMHPNFIEMVEYLPSEIKFGLSTNGGIRKTEFYRDLAQLLQKKKQNYEMWWCIDGMEDTHQIHRRNVDWHKLVANLEQFQKHGGRSLVVMTVFKHNEHQIDDVKNLCKKLGVQTFKIRPSYDERPLFAKKYGKWNETWIENGSLKFPRILFRRSDQNDLPRKSEADNSSLTKNFPCPWLKKDQAVQISNDGNVWPCCFTAEPPYRFDMNDDIFKQGKGYNNDINHYSFDEIFSGPLYTEMQNIWNNELSSTCVSCLSGTMGLVQTPTA